jgi:putative thioredoxin
MQTVSDSDYIAEIDHAGFERLVLAKSHEMPVVADFWAAWCGPCQMLMPMLAKLAEEYAGKFFLAKINTDVERELATQYGIRSLPTVKIFKNGKVVDEFMGVQPEPAIREMIDRHLPRPSDALIDQAAAARDGGDTAGARRLLERAKAEDPAHDRVKLELAALLIDLGEFDQAEQTLGQLTVASIDDPDVQAVRARLQLARLAADPRSRDELERQVAAHPEDCEARFSLAGKLVTEQHYEAAMDNLLEIVRRDRSFRDDGARRELLSVFSLLGSDHPLVRKYRGRLAMAIN